MIHDAFMFISSYLKNYENNKHGKICLLVMLINLHKISRFCFFVIYIFILCAYTKYIYFAYIHCLVFCFLKLLSLLVSRNYFNVSITCNEHKTFVVFCKKKLSFFIFICRTSIVVWHQEPAMF